jgi:rubrerythrin
VATEQNKTLVALQKAVQIETDGKEFYLKASRESGNKLGKELLKSLAAEEDIHRQKFEEIYDSVRDKKAWPKTEFKADKGRRLRTIFAEATHELGASLKAPATELDAVKTAMDMENKTYDFYKTQSKDANYNAERDFYEALAAQERTHHQVLLDYYEYLEDPAAWFVKVEHPHLDGG